MTAGFQLVVGGLTSGLISVWIVRSDFHQNVYWLSWLLVEQVGGTRRWEVPSEEVVYRCQLLNFDRGHTFVMLDFRGK